jgi:hypothetical protein
MLASLGTTEARSLKEEGNDSRETEQNMKNTQATKKERRAGVLQETDPGVPTSIAPFHYATFLRPGFDPKPRAN